MSQVRHIDAAGVEVLLQCMRAAVKRDGDLKLAALSSQAAIVLELTRTGRLFEIYETVHRGGEELQLLPAQRDSHISTLIPRRESSLCLSQIRFRWPRQTMNEREPGLAA